MTPFQKVLLLIVAIGVVIFAFRRWQENYKPPVRHRAPRSKRPDDSYQATNSRAKLLTETVALRKRNAQWPEILKTLNPSDEPRIRTILLELRWPNLEKPHSVLQEIEDTCLSAGLQRQSPSRVELLEMAKTRNQDAAPSS
jgi:hypothetical protein